MPAYVADLQRMRAAQRKLATDEFLETQVGRLRLEGKLSDTEAGNDRLYAAAKLYFEAAVAKDAALGLAFRRWPRGQDLNAVPGRSDAEEDYDTIRRRQRAIQRHDQAEAAVGKGASLQALHAVVIYDESPVGWETIIHLRAALQALAVYFKRVG